MEKKKEKEKEKIEDKVSIRDITIIKHYRNGKLIEERKVEDLVVAVGKAQIAGLVGGLATGTASYMAVGTGTTSPSISDTALGSEVLRVQTSNSLVTTNTTNDTLQLQGNFSFTASYAITEMGVFNASSGGTMFIRNTFGAINVVAGDTITIISKLVFS
ncbi:MAG: hypothetical protein JTT12_05530 [Candidatus Brockarchaeota archaeon]|nr:hypothetical protein [Candidatus Brockarchaeota archaeon]